MPTTDATARDLCTLALQAAGPASGSNTPNPEDLDLAFRLCNGMLDIFSMDRLFIFNVDFTEYDLTANVQDYLIGPGGSGDFLIPTRPSQVVSGQLRLNTNPVTYVRLNQLDDDGWARLPVLNVNASYPVAFYYSPSWPNGTLKLWGKPQASLAIRLETWDQFSQFPDLDTAFSFPQGYYELLWTNLALRCQIPAFGYDEPSKSIKDLAAASIARVTSNNMTPPPQMVADMGTQGVRQSDQTAYRNLFSPNPAWFSNGN